MKESGQSSVCWVRSDTRVMDLDTVASENSAKVSRKGLTVLKHQFDTYERQIQVSFCFVLTFFFFFFQKSDHRLGVTIFFCVHLRKTSILNKKKLPVYENNHNGIDKDQV